MSETDIPISGFTAPGLEAVRDAFAANFRDMDELGAGFAVIHRGKLVASLLGGWADRGRTREWAADTIVPVYSTTKGISALVVASLVDRLPAGYETPVADVWPEFAAHGKGAVTIGEALSHQAGLPGFATEIDPDLWLDPPACAAAIAALPPMWPPGTAHGYHPLTWGYLAGEIARRISGETLGTTLRAMFPDVDFRIGLPESEHARVGDLLRPKALADLGELTEFRRAAFVHKWSAPNRAGAVWREIEIPSANGHGTAESVAAIYDTYAHGGDGLLRPGIFEELIRPRTHGPDLVLPMVTSFGAGIMLNSHGLFGPNPATLGHCGWGGSMAVADPDAELTCAYVMNRQSPVLVGDPRAVRLVEAVYEAL
ncbi:MAG: beta-lactamase family protein [Hyphomonas sp.]|nr:beta-lactamase family protein [Hyphomonas sp.]